MDRVEYLARRAAAGLELFPSSERILEVKCWTAKNGYQHVLEVIRLVAGHAIEDKFQPPYADPRWVKKCEYKRMQRRRFRKRLGKKWLRHQAELKRQSR